MNQSRASAAAARSSEPPVEFVCTVSGLPKVRGALTEKAICDRFALRIREALGLAVIPKGQILAGSRARWVKLQIRFLPRDRAEAKLTSRLHRNAIDHPVLAVQVMDKPMDLDDIDKLARLAGKTLAGTH